MLSALPSRVVHPLLPDLQRGRRQRAWAERVGGQREWAEERVGGQREWAEERVGGQGVGPKERVSAASSGAPSTRAWMSGGPRSAHTRTPASHTLLAHLGSERRRARQTLALRRPQLASRPPLAQGA